MMRAGLNDPKNPLIVLGLSEGNVRRLKADQPVKVEIRSCGVDLPGHVVICYGATEQELEGRLRRAGLIGPETTGETDPRLTAEADIRREHTRVLVCTVGLPRSGKSTWALSQAYPIVSPDAIRLAIHGSRFIAEAEPFVWATAKAMVRALFYAGHNTVVVDATNNTRKRRDEWRSKEWATYFKPIDTTAAVCVERAQAEGDGDIIPVIERMNEQSEPLADDEPLWP